MEPRNKIVAGILAIFLGTLGVHAFYIGNTKMGVIMLLGTIISFPLMLVVIGILTSSAIVLLALVQGILYLVASDSEFHNKYVVRQKWL